MSKKTQKIMAWVMLITMVLSTLAGIFIYLF